MSDEKDPPVVLHKHVFAIEKWTLLFISVVIIVGLLIFLHSIEQMVAAYSSSFVE